MTLWVQVAGIGITAPGLPDWPSALPVLAGRSPYLPAPLAIEAPAILPANERRRAGSSVRLALRVAAEACHAAECPPQATVGVFASATGDSEIAHQMLEALAEPLPAVSPTRFHNSVHNAAAGYWSIATGSHQPATSVGAGDGSFATGLMLATAQLAGDGRPVLLVAYDLPFPAPLCDTRPVSAPFAAALLLTLPQPGGLALQIALRPEGGAQESGVEGMALERLRVGNPAARSLPLLAAIASGAPGRLALPTAGQGQLEVELGRAG